MLKRKQVLAVAGVVCVLAVSLSVLYVQASPAWTVDDMVSWMETVGKPKIWKILRNTNQMKPKIDAIDDKMGQGLVGESYAHSFIFATAETLEWAIPVVPTHPKKFSLWVDITTMDEGDTITVTLMIDREGTGNYYIYWDGSAYSTWEWTADADTRFHWQVADQLAISNNWRVKLQISYTPVTPPVTLHCEAIIEEV